MATHLLDSGCHSMRELYAAEHLIPTSNNADILLIRSHIAYHTGRPAAARALIAASRGHSYRVDLDCTRFIVRIADHYDHRLGVTGFDYSAGPVVQCMFA